MTRPAELDDTATQHARPAAATDGPLGAGVRLGHFRVERLLGAGGMGEVYLATDLALDRPVALKVLPAATTHDASRRDRLIREARAQARVIHPNVGHIYFIGEEAGRTYFAMEYVAGETLAARIGTGAMSIDDALAAIHDAALGLREAQRSGFTHRDVKPSNLMFDAHGKVKVLDFGLVAGSLGTADGPPRVNDRTDTGPPVSVPQTSLAGTPLYMAPEQARGEPVDLRADIYALGATLYHLVSGAPPFQAATAKALESLHATAVRPTLPRGRVPRAQSAAVQALCGRMMAPSPSDRFASYDELLRAIQLIQHTRPAGFWVRAIAALLDFMLCGLPIALLVSGVVYLMANNREGADPTPAAFAGIAAVYWVGLVRFGKTPGMALLDLEVVALATGRKPSWLQAAIRTGVLYGGVVTGELLELVLTGLPLSIAKIVSLISTLAPPLWLLASTLVGPAKRALWDRASGTLVRYRTNA